MDEDLWSQNRIFQRRPSLTFPKPLGTRDSFHNRSLQDFSNRIKLSAEDELESHRRRQSAFNWSGVENSLQARSPPQSSDSLSSDTVNDEWKQVTSQQRCFLLCPPKLPERQRRHKFPSDGSRWPALRRLEGKGLIPVSWRVLIHWRGRKQPGSVERHTSGEDCCPQTSQRAFNPWRH